MKALEHEGKTETVATFPEADRISDEELLEMPRDILVPAALEGVITKDNAPRIKVRIIAETANRPTTPEAGPILFANNVFMLPNVLANAGGVTVSRTSSGCRILRCSTGARMMRMDACVKSSSGASKRCVTSPRGNRWTCGRRRTSLRWAG